MKHQKHYKYFINLQLHISYIIYWFSAKKLTKDYILVKPGAHTHPIYWFAGNVRRVKF